MIGMSVGLEDPLDLQALRLDERDDLLGGFEGGAPCSVIEVEHAVDDRRRLRCGIMDDVAGGERRFVEESLHVRRADFPAKHGVNLGRSPIEADASLACLANSEANGPTTLSRSPLDKSNLGDHNLLSRGLYDGRWAANCRARRRSGAPLVGHPPYRPHCGLRCPRWGQTKKTRSGSGHLPALQDLPPS